MTVREYLEVSLLSDDDHPATLLERLLMAAIILSVVSLVLETEPTLYSQWADLFSLLEIVFVTIFSIEYLARLYFIGKIEKYRGLKGRLRYMLTPYAVIDLVAILPSLVAGLYSDLMLFRIIRLLRMFRVAKLIKTNRSLMLFIEAFYKSRSQLAASLVVTMFLLFLGGVLLYLVESDVQPEAFGSIPRAMWWSMATLTTVGYGDAYPVTAIGKLLASAIAILGIGIVAMPAGIIAANFTKELDGK